MTQGQWTALGLILGLFALEAAHNPGIKKWLVGSLTTLKGAITPAQKAGGQ